MTYHSQKNGTLQIVTMGRDMADAQTQAAGWAHATSLAANEEIELIQITKLACERAEFDPQVGKAAQKAEYREFGKITKQAPRPRREAQFACQECGRKFKSRQAAERASWSGCPGCGATDIDLA
jgi:rubrerythrin